MPRAYFDAAIRRDGYLYTLHFERGELVGEMKKTPADQKKTGSSFHWLPDLDVFTDIDIPKEYYEDTLKRQAVVNAGITFRFRCESAPGKFDETEYFYENGILDYVREITQDQSLTAPQFWEAERKGRDRSDMDEYKVKISAALCFSNQVSRHGVLPQLVLAGIWRRAGEGGQKRLCLRHRRLSEIHQQIYEERDAKLRSRMWQTVWCW